MFIFQKCGEHSLPQLSPQDQTSPKWPWRGVCQHSKSKSNGPDGLFLVVSSLAISRWQFHLCIDASCPFNKHSDSSLKLKRHFWSKSEHRSTRPSASCAAHGPLQTQQRRQPVRAHLSRGHTWADTLSHHSAAQTRPNHAQEPARF